MQRCNGSSTEDTTVLHRAGCPLVHFRCVLVALQMLWEVNHVSRNDVIAEEVRVCHDVERCLQQSRNKVQEQGTLHQFQTGQASGGGFQILHVIKNELWKDHADLTDLERNGNLQMTVLSERVWNPEEVNVCRLFVWVQSFVLLAPLVVLLGHEPHADCECHHRAHGDSNLSCLRAVLHALPAHPLSVL